MSPIVIVLISVVIVVGVYTLYKLTAHSNYPDQSHTPVIEVPKDTSLPVELDLEHSPLAPEGVSVCINGVTQVEGYDFTVSDISALLFTGGALVTGDYVFVRYVDKDEVRHNEEYHVV